VLGRKASIFLDTLFFHALQLALLTLLAVPLLYYYSIGSSFPYGNLFLKLSFANANVFTEIGILFYVVLFVPAGLVLVLAVEGIRARRLRAVQRADWSVARKALVVTGDVSD
jgi:hypothetical protein